MLSRALRTMKALSPLLLMIASPFMIQGIEGMAGSQSKIEHYTVRDSKTDFICVGLPLSLRPACIARAFSPSCFGAGFALLKLGAPPCHLPIVESLAVYLEEKHFEGAALIAQEGKILLCKGYGLADREHGVKNTPQTVFRLGSITKSFTAIAILQLQEEGQLNVEDPISTYLPDYPRGDEITLHHLLTHTSGIPSITEFPNLSEIQRHPSTPQRVIAYFQDLPLEFEPGSECKYSDSGYIVLGAILEKVAGVSYEEYLQEHILNPLKMKSTYFDRNQRLIPHRAAGYNLNKQGEVVHAEFIEMSFPHGAGSLASTVEDLYRFDQALKGDLLLSKESREELFKIQASSKKFPISYGYGFFVDKERQTVGHMGHIEGFRATLYRHLEGDVTVILLSNQEATPLLALEEELFSLLRSWRS